MGNCICDERCLLWEINFVCLEKYIVTKTVQLLPLPEQKALKGTVELQSVTLEELFFVFANDILKCSTHTLTLGQYLPFL